MPRKGNNDRPAEGHQGGEWPGGGESYLQLLRYGHIFASAVREILEVQLLRETSPLPLTLSQFHLLKLMTNDGRHQIGEVADFLGVSPPAATKNIDKLEGLGLVIRSPSKGDRRATLLSVSSKGRRLVQKYEELKTERLTPVLGDFRPEELEEFSRLLERFSVSLLKREGTESGSCLRCAAYIESGCSVGEARGDCPYQRIRAARSPQVASKESP